MTSKPYPSSAAAKAVKEGSAVASAALLLAVAAKSLRPTTNLPWPPDQDPIVIGALTGLLTALFRWLKKRIKRRRARNGNT